MIRPRNQANAVTNPVNTVADDAQPSIRDGVCDGVTTAKSNRRARQHTENTYVDSPESELSELASRVADHLEGIAPVNRAELRMTLSEHARDGAQALVVAQSVIRNREPGDARRPEAVFRSALIFANE
jgi:hypothetical protein